MRTLPRRNTHKRKLVVALFLLCAFLVLACLALAALNVLYRHRGALYLKAGGTLSPEEGVEAGVALEHLVHPSELPRNIQHGDDEATKLEKYKLHSSAHVVPHAHLPMGCEIDVEYDRLRIRSGMFDSTGPMWNPWPPIATHSFDASDGVVTKLLGVFPMHCSEAYARRDVDLHHLVDRAKPLMRHTRRKCVVGPQLGMNATVLVLHLQDEDVPFTPGSDFLFVAVDPVMELKGLSEERYHEHEETCRFRGFTPSRWRSTAIDISFTNALDGQPRMLRVVGTAAAAVQHCMDMFVSNPCVK